MAGIPLENLIAQQSPEMQEAIDKEYKKLKAKTLTDFERIEDMLTQTKVPFTKNNNFKAGENKFQVITISNGPPDNTSTPSGYHSCWYFDNNGKLVSIGHFG